MKKKLLVFITLFFMVMMPVFVNAANTKCNNDKIVIETINMLEKTDSVHEKTAANITNNKINLDLQMADVDDYILYEVKVKNNGTEDALFDATNLNTGSKHIIYGITYNNNGTDADPVVPANSERTLRLTVKYLTPVGDGEYSGGSYTENRNTSTDGTIVNPKTGDASRVFIFIMFVIGFGLIFLIVNKNKYSKFFVLLLGVMLLPLAVKAACSCQFELYSKVEILKKETHTNMISLGNNGETTFFNNSPITKDKVESIEFFNTLPTGTNNNSWDVSLDKDGSVMAYYTDTDNDNLYEVAIRANGKIILPDNSSYLFANFTKAEVITGFANVDTTRVTNMNAMFKGDAKLTALLILDFDTTRVTNMTEMFSGCTTLAKIMVEDGFVTTGVTSDNNMFLGDTALVGGAGTTYSASHVNKEYARVDGGSSAPGYFTGTGTTPGGNTEPGGNTDPTPDPDPTPTEPEVTTTGGTLATGNTGNGTFFNSSPINKPQVERIIIQTTTTAPTGSLGSWNAASSGTVTAYYTDANNNNLYEVYLTTNGKLVAPTNSKNLFRGFTELVSISGIKNLDTSNVTNMSNMFNSCSKLTTLDLEKMDTSKVTDMSYMFSNCTALTELDLFDFNTSAVTNMEGMFKLCENVVTIYVSNGFVVTGVTQSGSMFYNCNRIKGGGVTAYDAAHVDKEYARPYFTGTPGYFTLGALVPGNEFNN